MEHFRQKSNMIGFLVLRAQWIVGEYQWKKRDYLGNQCRSPVWRPFMCPVVGVWMRVSAVRMVRNEAKESTGPTGGSDMWAKETVLKSTQNFFQVPECFSFVVPFPIYLVIQGPLKVHVNLRFFCCSLSSSGTLMIHMLVVLMVSHRSVLPTSIFFLSLHQIQ